MDKIIDVPIFLEFYGKLLTERQVEIISLYSDEDYSLTEIADNLKISRQGVYDAVKSIISALEDYENKIGLVRRYWLRKGIGENLHDAITNISATEIDSPNRLMIEQELERIREGINKLIEV